MQSVSCLRLQMEVVDVCPKKDTRDMLWSPEQNYFFLFWDRRLVLVWALIVNGYRTKHLLNSFPSPTPRADLWRPGRSVSRRNIDFSILQYIDCFSTARICPMLELVCYSGREGLHQTASQKLAKKHTTRTSLFLKQVDEYKTNLVIHVRWMGVVAHTLHGKKTHIFQICSMYVSCEFISLA